MLRRILVAALAIALLATGVWGWHRWTHRFVQTDSDLFCYLPRTDGSTLFLNLNLIRRAHAAGAFPIPRPVRNESDYARFMQSTGFEYERDLDTVAGHISTDAARLAFLLRGQFEWGRLSRYIQSQGGQCSGDGMCHIRSANTGRVLTVYRIQPNVLAVQLAPDMQPRLPRHTPQGDQPESPIWVQLSAGVLRQANAWPGPLQLLAATVQPAAPVTLTVDPAVESSQAAFVLNLQGEAATPTAAAAIRTQLEIQSKLLQLQLARAHQQPDPSSLIGLFTAGDFQTDGKSIHASWPINKQLLQKLQ